jgi:hypothetical protein
MARCCLMEPDPTDIDRAAAALFRRNQQARQSPTPPARAALAQRRIVSEGRRREAPARRVKLEHGEKRVRPVRPRALSTTVYNPTGESWNAPA